MSPHAILMMALALAAPAQHIYRYTCEDFPENAGFVRGGTMDCERRIEEGWFSQTILRYGEGEHNGQDDYYVRTLADFAGAATFYCEWRMLTNGPKSNLLGSAPAGLSMGGRSGINYHFTIARDQMKFRRDSRLPIYFFSFTDGMPHEHRIELYGEHWYSYLIDGAVKDAGRPEGAYPGDDSEMIWWSRYYLDEHISRWDYLELGEMPDPGVDCDAVKRLRAKCRQGNGKWKIKGKLRTQLPPGTELRVTCSGDRQTVQIGDNGKAKFRYRRQPGDRTVLLLDCPAISQDISCE